MEKKHLAEKIVIVVNGKGGVGKDTFCDCAAAYFATWNISAITPVKEIARICGWNGEKDMKSRKFLADLKQLLVDYNGYPNQYLEGEYHRFLQSEAELLFVHIREAEQIADFLRRIPGKKLALLVRSNRLGTAAYGNAADDLVEAYDYDAVFQNDVTLEALPGAVEAFLTDLLSREGVLS
jgi:hypothetical protein